MATYAEKLKNPKWQKKRLEVLSRDNFTCKFCGDTETTLHVHHKKYTGEPHDAPLKDLETLCEDCHYVETNNTTYKVNAISKYVAGDIKVIFAKIERLGDYIIIIYHKVDGKYEHIGGYGGRIIDKLKQIL